MMQGHQDLDSASVGEGFNVPIISNPMPSFRPKLSESLSKIFANVIQWVIDDGI